MTSHCIVCGAERLRKDGKPLVSNLRYCNKCHWVRAKKRHAEIEQQSEYFGDSAEWLSKPLTKEKDR